MEDILSISIDNQNIEDISTDIFDILFLVNNMFYFPLRIRKKGFHVAYLCSLPNQLGMNVEVDSMPRV